MRRFFHSGSIGAAQFAAAALLLVYLAQCVWLIEIQAKHALANPGWAEDSDRAFRGYLGQQWRGGAIAGTPGSVRSGVVTGGDSASRTRHLRVNEGFDQDRSPLYYLLGAAPFAAWSEAASPTARSGPVMALSPYLFFGVMLGGSIWYVSRRLYGNVGGFIALVMYCFSPATIAGAAGTASAGEMGAVWGAFGAVW